MFDITMLLVAVFNKKGMHIDAVWTILNNSTYKIKHETINRAKCQRVKQFRIRMNNTQSTLLAVIAHTKTQTSEW